MPSGSPSNPADRNCWSLPPGGPAGTLTIDPLVEPALDLLQVNARLKGRRSSVARCYRTVAAGHTVDSKVRARFTAPGRIEVLSVSGDDQSTEFVACVKTLLRGWSMPRLAGAVDTTLAFHFTAAAPTPKP